MTLENKYKKEISTILNSTPDQLFLFWKGRIALYAALKSLNIKEGDQIILPAFTCVVVPNAIKYLKATPIYVDINCNTYNTDLNKIKNAITPKTKAVIIQNTFGLSSEVELITAYCSAQNIPTIEDCTHGFGGEYEGKPNGSYCDFAFYSTQWNKPYSTGVGGFLMVNNKQYLNSIEKIYAQAKRPSFKDTTMLKSLIFARENILNANNYWTLLKLYRWLSKNKLVVGSSSPEELASTNIPSNYFIKSSKVQAKAGIKNIKKLSNKNTLRLNNAKRYSSFLKKNNKIYVSENLFQNHSFLKYPLLVNKRSLFIEKAEALKIEIGEWFVSPLHPIESDLSSWDLEINDFPIAKEKAKQMVNLPTDTENIEAVICFLKNNLGLINDVI